RKLPVVPHPAWLHQSAFAPGQQRQLSLPALSYAQYERASARRAFVPQPEQQVSGVHDVPHADPWFQLRSLLLPLGGRHANGFSKESRRLFLWIRSARGLPILDNEHFRPEFWTDTISRCFQLPV